LAVGWRRWDIRGSMYSRIGVVAGGVAGSGNFKVREHFRVGWNNGFRGMDYGHG